MLPSKADAMKAVNKKRRELFALQELVKTPDGAGGFASVWTTRATAWAEPRKPTTSTEVVAGAVSSVMTREWDIRYYPDVQKGWRALWGSDVLPIVHTYHYGRETTVIVCREVVK